MCRESCGTTFDGNRKQATKEMLQAKTASKDWTTLTTVAAPTSAASCTTSHAACNGSRLSSSNKTIHLPSASTNKGAHKQLCNAAWEMRWLGAQSSYKEYKAAKLLENCVEILPKYAVSVAAAATVPRARARKCLVVFDVPSLGVCVCLSGSVLHGPVATSVRCAHLRSSGWFEKFSFFTMLFVAFRCSYCCCCMPLCHVIVIWILLPLLLVAFSFSLLQPVFFMT